MQKIKQTYKNLSDSLGKRLSKISVVEFVIILVVIVILLFIINYLISSQTINNEIVSEDNQQTKLVTNPLYRKQVTSEYPELVRELPYVGEGCLIVIERDEEGNEQLVVKLLEPAATSDNCGAILFMKRNLDKLDGIKVIERTTNLEYNI